jgi:hypothetical protein
VGAGVAASDANSPWQQAISVGRIILEIVGSLTLIVGAVYAVYAHRDLVGWVSSDIKIYPLASTQLYMTFIAENDGNRAGSIGRVTGEFHFMGDDSIVSAPLRLDVLEYDSGGTVIKPGEQTIRVYFKDESRLQSVIHYFSSVKNIQRADCIFRFEIINFDGSSEHETLTEDCGRYYGEYLRMRNSAVVTFPSNP